QLGRAIQQHAFAHARGYWNATAASAHIGFRSAELIDTLIGAVALFGARSLSDARAVVKFVLAEAGESQAQRTDLVEWLHGLYPGEPGSYWGPVAPRMVASALA